MFTNGSQWDNSQIPYWPGSPYGGNDYNSAEDGDAHNWHVWHGLLENCQGILVTIVIEEITAYGVKGIYSSSVEREPGWIKAHGTGTRAGDAAEYLGLAAVFEEQLQAIPMTSIKPLIGHCLGASGAVEAVATILAIENGIIPATLGTTEVDPAFPLCRMALKRQHCARSSSLMLSQSFGGKCCVLNMRAA